MEDNPNVTFKATLNGASETPPNTSAATGSATLIFNTYKIFTIFVEYTGLTPMQHMFKGDIGVSGDEVFGITVDIHIQLHLCSPGLRSRRQISMQIYTI